MDHFKKVINLIAIKKYFMFFTQRTKPARRLDVAEPFTRSAATSALTYVKKTGTLKKNNLRDRWTI